MPRREETWLREMLDAARTIQSHIEGHTVESFMADRKTSGAVLHEISVLGEAAKQVSETTCQKYPQINWRLLKRTRDAAIHSYFTINLRTIWNLIHDDFPDLIVNLEAIVETEYGPKN